MNCFELFFPKLLQLEGGFRVVKLKGEEDITVAGIYRRWHPKWEGWKLIENGEFDRQKLMELVKEFYWELWQSSKAGRMPCSVAIAYFNSVVLSGQYRASRFLQMALNRQGCRLKVDGIVGRKTLSCVRRKNALLTTLHILRLQSIFVLNLDSKRIYFKGWVNRSFVILEFILKEAKQ